jgi:hypothetical protein
MCNFVLVALSDGVNIERATAIAKNHNFALIPSDISLAGGKRRDPLSLFYTSKMCDCDTPVGAGQNVNKPWRPSDKEIQSRKKKGWGDRKIDRWIAEKMKVARRDESRRAASAAASAGSLQKWFDFAKDILSSAPGQRFGLVLTWSPGQVVELEDEIETGLDAAETDLLYMAEENVLYSFARARSAA